MWRHLVMTNWNNFIGIFFDKSLYDRNIQANCGVYVYHIWHKLHFYHKIQHYKMFFWRFTRSCCNPFISSAWIHCKRGTDDGNTNMKLAFENCEFIGLESLAVSTCMLWSGETPMYIRCLYWTSTLLPAPLTQWTGTYFS